MHSDSRFLLPVLLALGLAGCGGGGSPVGAAGPGAQAQLKAAAAVASVDALESALVRRPIYQIDPAKVFVAGVSSGGFVFAVPALRRRRVGVCLPTSAANSLAVWAERLREEAHEADLAS